MDITWLGSTESTNCEIKEAIGQGKPEGTVVAAFEQKGGYGRQGRQWHSPQGGLYVSTLLRPQSHDSFTGGLPTLSLALSIAVRRAFMTCGVTEDIQIKWPNDILCAQGKLCGISVEVIGDAVCMGIGANIFRPEEDSSTPSAQGKYTKAYLADIVAVRNAETTVPADGLAEHQALYIKDATLVLLHEVESVYNQWLVEGFSPFRNEYRANAFLQGQAVQLVSLANDILYEGVVSDVDDDGFLCLVDSKGSLIKAHSGEVHIK